MMAMVSGRALYGLVAKEASDQAGRLLDDADALRKRGSRGPACSLAILSIEESSKALVYNMAHKGIIRIVGKKPNNVTTYRKESLQNHRFKHAVAKSFIVDWFEFSPFYTAIRRAGKRTWTNSEVDLLIQRAVYRYKEARIDLLTGGKGPAALADLITLFDRLDSLKNSGFYVDHDWKTVMKPKSTDRVTLDKVVELAMIMNSLTKHAIVAEVSESARMMHIDGLRKIRKMSRRKAAHV